VVLDRVARTSPASDDHHGEPRDALARRSRAHPNVYTDLSGSLQGWRNRTPPVFQELFYWPGAFRKIVFGSDVHCRQLPQALDDHRRILGPTEHYPLVARICNEERISWRGVRFTTMDEYLDWTGRPLSEDPAVVHGVHAAVHGPAGRAAGLVRATTSSGRRRPTRWRAGACGSSRSSGLRRCVSPARVSFLTGRMPRAHGVHDWLRGEEYGVVDEDRYLSGPTTTPQVLADNGWRDGQRVAEERYITDDAVSF
jgi:hypothetical protein